MQNDIPRERELASFILKHNSTIRQTAKVFNMSKSSVHNDVAYKLKNTDYPLYLRTHDVLQNNFDVKHIRGGESTKKKYEQIRDITR